MAAAARVGLLIGEAQSRTRARELELTSAFPFMVTGMSSDADELGTQPLTSVKSRGSLSLFRWL
jgi:hypothetical protein